MSICLSRQTQNAAARDSLIDEFEKLFVVYGAEEILQVRVYNPLVALIQFSPYLAQCFVGGPPLPIPVVGIIEHWLEDRLQPVQQRLLTYPIIDRRDAKRTKLSRLACLGDQASEDRLRFILTVPQLPVQTIQIR